MTGKILTFDFFWFFTFKVNFGFHDPPLLKVTSKAHQLKISACEHSLLYMQSMSWKSESPKLLCCVLIIIFVCHFVCPRSILSELSNILSLGSSKFLIKLVNVAFSNANVRSIELECFIKNVSIFSNIFSSLVAGACSRCFVYCFTCMIAISVL